MEKKIVELSCKTLLVDVSEYPLNFLLFTHRLTANTYMGCTVFFSHAESGGSKLHSYTSRG